METFATLLSLLLESRTQAQIFHWRFSKTPGSGFGHLATGDYYESIGGLTDKLAESFMGKNGLVSGFKPAKEFSEDTSTCVQYFQRLAKAVELFRQNECCKDGYIQNQIDTILELLYTTIYKLQNQI